MNYKKHYDALIVRSKIRILTGYTEKHHILPKCMGGDNSKHNIVRLTPEEHYVAHQLLVKIYNLPALVYAANMMTSTSNTTSRTNKLYGWLRKRLQAAAKQRTGSKNGSYGKLWYHNLADSAAGKYLPGTEPQGWSKGRIPKKINKCNVCGTATNTPLQYWCNGCRPKPEQTVFKSVKLKSEYSDKEKMDALVAHNGSIRRALLSLGLNDSGTHYRVMKKLKASLAQLD